MNRKTIIELAAGVTIAVLICSAVIYVEVLYRPPLEDYALRITGATFSTDGASFPRGQYITVLVENQGKRSCRWKDIVIDGKPELWSESIDVNMSSGEKGNWTFRYSWKPGSGYTIFIPRILYENQTVLTPSNRYQTGSPKNLATPLEITNVTFQGEIAYDEFGLFRIVRNPHVTITCVNHGNFTLFVFGVNGSTEGSTRLMMRLLPGQTGTLTEPHEWIPTGKYSFERVALREEPNPDMDFLGPKADPYYSNYFTATAPEK